MMKTLNSKQNRNSSSNFLNLVKVTYQILELALSNGEANIQ